MKKSIRVVLAPEIGALPALNRGLAGRHDRARQPRRGGRELAPVLEARELRDRDRADDADDRDDDQQLGQRIAAPAFHVHRLRQLGF